MPYAIELYLDKEASAKVREIHLLLKKNGIRIDEGTEPHVSLCIYEDLPIREFEKELRLFAGKIEPFEVVFTHVASFQTAEPVIFLAPEVSQKLLDVHLQFNDDFSKYNDAVWDYYRPQTWVPHCTLCMGLTRDMYIRAQEILKDVGLPIKATFKRIGVLKFRPNEQLFTFGLGENL